jgi:hypothetical protein
VPPNACNIEPTFLTASACLTEAPPNLNTCIRFNEVAIYKNETKTFNLA